MAVSVAGMSGFVGAGSADETLIGESLAEAVELLGGYLRHLRQITDGAVTGEVAASYDATSKTYTWTDTRALAVEHYTGPVPVPVLDRATREVCSDLFARRNAPGGIINQQFAGGDAPGSGPARLHRDPLTPAYPLLSRWVVPF